MSTDLQASISSAISQANAKSAEKSEGNFNEQVARDRVSAAQSRIGVAESKVDRAQGEAAKIDEQLAPPPTKDVSTGGKSGGTKTVVDQEEVRRLNSSKANFDSQIAQAKQEVEKAQTEALAASSDVLSQTGINQDTQNEIDKLMSKASSIQNTLSEGGSVDDSEIQGLTDKFAEISGGLTDENNPAGLLSEAFYDPFAEALENIAEYLETPVETTEDAAYIPPEGTADRELYDAGITNQETIANLVEVNTELSDFDRAMGETNTFDQPTFERLVEKFNTNTEGLTQGQKDTGVNKDSAEIIERIQANVGA